MRPAPPLPAVTGQQLIDGLWYVVVAPSDGPIVMTTAEAKLFATDIFANALALEARPKLGTYCADGQVVPA